MHPRPGASFAKIGDEPWTFATAWQRFRPLVPLIFGLAFCRAGLIIACYGSYEHTDEGVYTDGSMLLALVGMGVILLAIMVRDLHIRKRACNIIVRVAILLEAASIVAVTVLQEFDADNFAGRMALCAVCSFSASWCMFYWLRRARGVGSTTAAVFVFSTLALSEVELYLMTLIPPLPTAAVGTVLVLVQYLCIPWARSSAQPYSIPASTPSADFFGFAKTTLQSKQFLAATAIGVGLLSIVIGLLRGYPDGASISFMPQTRLAYALMTILLCVVFALSVMRGRTRAMTTDAFIAMELLACVALCLYAAFPDRLDIGAVVTTSLNAFMVAFSWYVIIAFMGAGRRDPFYYALGGWIIWLGCRGAMRMAMLAFSELTLNDMLVITVMGLLVVVSTQVTLVQYMHIAQGDVDAAPSTPVAAPPGAMGTWAMGAWTAGTWGTAADGSAPVRPANAFDRVVAARGGAAQGADGSAVGEGVDAALGAGAFGEAARAGGAAPAPVPATVAGREIASAAEPAFEPALEPALAPEPAPAPKPREDSMLMRVMGLDEADNLTAMRQAAMRHSAEELGRQFMLSEREIEVLSLYALGWTQKRVAEELYISPGTAHAHIKRIYAKTGLHSRQEILDYMQEYTS